MSSGVMRKMTGSFTGTGAAVEVKTIGFRPRHVRLMNRQGLCQAEWTDSMPDASAFKQITDGTTTFITSNGITPLSNGFSLGADADLNVSGEDVHWVAEE